MGVSRAINAANDLEAGALERDDAVAYREHERLVLGMLATRYADLDPEGRRELYHEAWAAVLKRRRQGSPVESLRSYLLGAADKAASKRVYGPDARRRTTFDPSVSHLSSVPDPADAPEDEVVAADEARRLRLLIDELHDGEAAVLKLRIDEGLEPAEIRARLGLNERQYRRQAERAVRALVGEFEAFDRGEWARRKRSLLCACVMGIASERQQRRAAELVAQDPLCRAMMHELRHVAGRVAAALPVPVAAAGTEHLDPAEWSSRLADSAFAVRQKLSGFADRVVDRQPSSTSSRPLRDRAVEALADTKHHAVNLYLRGTDPVPLAATRPGATAAVLAGCLAAGGSAYCAVQGVPQELRAPFAGQATHRGDGAGMRKRISRAQAAPPTAVQPQGPSSSSPAGTSTSSRTTTPQASPAPAPAQAAQPAPPPTPDQEFEPSTPTASSSSSPSGPAAAGTATSSPRSTAKPAPAAGDSGEFSP